MKLLNNLITIIYCEIDLEIVRGDKRASLTDKKEIKEPPRIVPPSFKQLFAINVLFLIFQKYEIFA